MIYKTLLRIAVMTSFVATAAFADLPDGLYRPAGAAYSGWSCDPNDIGMDGGALSIGDGYITGVESRCELRNPRAVGDGQATEYVAICSAEGTEYRELLSISSTNTGVAIDRNGSRVEWTRCNASATGKTANHRALDTWDYTSKSASIISGGNSFSLSCRTYNASSTYPTAILAIPCAACFPNDATTYTLRVDDVFAEDYEFIRVSNAVGSESDLDFYPTWNEGLISALKAGSRLDVIDGTQVIASFPLAGSSKAISALATECN